MEALRRKDACWLCRRKRECMREDGHEGTRRGTRLEGYNTRETMTNDAAKTTKAASSRQENMMAKRV